MEIDVKEVSEYRNILDFMMDVKKASRPGAEKLEKEAPVQMEDPKKSAARSQTPTLGPSASWPSVLRAQSGPSFNGHCDGDLNLQ